jgi:hypothetical protein
LKGEKALVATEQGAKVNSLSDLLSATRATPAKFEEHPERSPDDVTPLTKQNDELDL